MRGYWDSGGAIRLGGGSITSAEIEGQPNDSPRPTELVDRILALMHLTLSAVDMEGAVRLLQASNGRKRTDARRLP